MDFVSIKKVFPGRFIDRYDVTYRLADGREKVYEMVSRSHDLQNQEQMWAHPAEAAVLIMTDESGERLLLNHEFRLPTGEWVYNFPAGVIEPGESPEQGARRELKEETGLDLLRVDEILLGSYSAVGFGNEKSVSVLGVAGGSFAPSNSAEEEIESGWFSREQVRALLQTEPFAARTQAYCYLWSKEK